MEKLEAIVEFGGTKRVIAFLIVSGIALLLGLLKIQPLPFDVVWIAVVLCGVPIVLEALIGLISKFDIKADVLVAIAMIASVIIGEEYAAAEIAFIMTLGSLLEELTVEKAWSGTEKMARLIPDTAHLVEDESEKVISVSEVKSNQILRVFEGERIPVDGTVITGQGAVDQSVMTGESMPVEVAEGSHVLGGTLNLHGTFDMRATDIGEDSQIGKMISLVKSASVEKSNVVRLADKWATWIVVMALATAIATYFVTGEIRRAVTILVVFCPCALVLATPTAIAAAIGNLTRYGILVREGDALERLSGITHFSFDKTGTLTSGVPQVKSFEKIGGDLDESELFRMIASLEQRFPNHPMAAAILSGYNKNKEKTGSKEAYDYFEVEDCSTEIGRGCSGRIQNHQILVGNLNYMNQEKIDLQGFDAAEDKKFDGYTVIYGAVDGILCARIVLEEEIREAASDAVKELKSMNIVPIMLTGDGESSARHIAENLGIEEFRARCLPGDKLNYIEKLQKDGNRICMVGDGVNDAPALKQANVGIAVGGIGRDIAKVAADIVMEGTDNIRHLMHAFELSRRMMTVIKLNIVFSLVLNFAAIALAMVAVLNPVAGALVHNVGSLIVIINSALLLGWKQKEKA